MLENYPYLLDFKQVQEILRIGRNQLLFRLQRQFLTNDITFDTMELKINVILIGGAL